MYTIIQGQAILTVQCQARGNRDLFEQDRSPRALHSCRYSVNKVSLMSRPIFWYSRRAACSR